MIETDAVDDTFKSRYSPLISQVKTLNIVPSSPWRRLAVNIVDSFIQLQLCLHDHAITRGTVASHSQFISNCTTTITMSVRSLALAALAPEMGSREQSCPADGLGRSQ